MKRIKSKPRPKPTAADLERMGRIKRGPCLACHANPFATGLHVEAHHLVRTVRLGHEQTVGLCTWHHRGQLKTGYTTSQMTAEFGPSLAKGSKPFHARYGTDPELLAKQNALLDQALIESHVNALPAHAAVLVRRARDEARAKSASRPCFNRQRPDRKPTPRCTKILPPRAASWKKSSGPV